MVADILWLGITLLLAPALAEFAKVNERKGFTCIAFGGVCYLMAAAFSFTIPNINLSLMQLGTTVFSIIGLITVLIGTMIFLRDLFK